MDRVAWAAGIFEGEGCFYLHDRNPYRKSPMSATLVMTDLDIVQRFVDAIPIPAKVHTAKRLYGKERKIRYTARYTGKRAVELADVLWPFLGERRRARLLEFGYAPL